MTKKYIVYLFYSFKSFLPFTPFMVPYLIEVKKFKNKEIYNVLNTYFFISSLTISLISFLLIDLLGDAMSLIVDLSMEIFAYYIFLTMKQRDFVFGKIVSVLHGSSTALSSVLKSVIISNLESDKYKDTQTMNNISILKCVTSVLASWIGQDLVICSGGHIINLYLSGISLTSALFMAFFLDKKQQTIAKQTNLNSIFVLKDYEILKYFFLTITANILVICLSFFSANIFIERRKCGKNSFGKCVFYILTPLRCITKIILKIYKFFNNEREQITQQENKKMELVVHGYVDGVAKIFSSVFCYLIAKIQFNESYRYKIALGISFVTILSLFLLYKLESLSLSYLFYTISFSLSTALKIIIFTVYADNKYKNFIFSSTMFLSSLIHIGLSFISMYYKSNVKDRFRNYLAVCIALVVGSLFVNLM